MGSLTAFLDIVILIGALQGFIFSALLFSTPKDRQSNRLLAWLLFLAALASLKPDPRKRICHSEEGAGLIFRRGMGEICAALF